MAWVRFPDGTRRKVERVRRADAEAGLSDLLDEREACGEAPPRRVRQLTFDDVIDAWLEAGCPVGKPASRARHHRPKSPNTIDNARSLLRGHLSPAIGLRRVERTTTPRLEELFERMSAAGYATSTVDRTWGYLNQACEWAVRQRMVQTNPAAEVLLPARRPARQRRSLTIDQVEVLIRDAIPADSQPAMWLTALMSGLRPGELAGLRWPFVDIDSEAPVLEVAERAQEIRARYAGQAAPKTRRSRRRIGLHPLLVAALRRHRDEQILLGRHDPDGFVFCTRNLTPYSLHTLRRSFRRLCARAGLGEDWTTYELRHSFVSLVSDQLDDLVKVADLVGHEDTRTTQGYRHPVRPSLPHAIDAWNRLLDQPAVAAD